MPTAASLSMLANRTSHLNGRSVGLLLADGADPDLLQALRRALDKAGARLVLVAPRCTGAPLADGKMQAVDAALDGAPSCLYDHVAVLGSDAGASALSTNPAALTWLRDAWRHLKVMALDDAGMALADAAGIDHDDAVVRLDAKKSVDHFVRMATQGKHFAREGTPGTDA